MQPLEHLPKKFGALLPYEIASSTSLTLIDFVTTHQHKDGGFRSLTVRDVKQESFWKPFRLTSTEKNIAHNGQPEGRSDFWNRHKTDLDWQWISSDITEVVKLEIEKIRPLYHHLNRVMILLQNPGTTVPMHRDMVAGSKYDNQMFVPTDPDIDVIENTYHQDQNYLCIKIPLTSRPQNNGQPRIEINGQKYSYDVGENFFLLNEVEMTHGAEAVDFFRGVIFIDGLLNMKSIHKMALRPIPISKV